jgi:4-amino-4-deoxy-L-arabinose transferase-like glycosyltransferase
MVRKVSYHDVVEELGNGPLWAYQPLGGSGMGLWLFGFLWLQSWTYRDGRHLGRSLIAAVDDWQGRQ